MINEQLDRMITKALEDGVLTDKEREILMRKAESLGIDVDEFELELESRLGMPNTNPPIPNNAPLKEGVAKCPACGALRKAMQTRCSDCGYEFSGTQGNSSMQKLMQMLEDIEGQRYDNQQSDGSSSGERIVGMLIKQVSQLGKSTNINNRKKELIRNFPIPNTREDILEFLSLAVPNAMKKGGLLGVFSLDRDSYELHNDFVPVWKAKCEQIIMKAKFSMKDDKKTLEEIMYYAKKLKIE